MEKENQKKEKIMKKFKLYYIALIIFVLFGNSINAQKTINGCNLKSNEWKSIALDSEKGIKSLIFSYKNCSLDLSKFSFLNVETKNNTDANIILDIKYFGPKPTNVFKGRYFLEPNSSNKNNLQLYRKHIGRKDKWFKFYKEVRALPGGFARHWNAFDLTKVKKVQVTISWENNSNIGSEVQIKTPVGVEEYTFPSMAFEDQKLPMLDLFGQLNSETWENKLISIPDLKDMGNDDYKRYKKLQFDAKFSKYGGFKDGPKLESTGYFYTTKYKGKWWFVDPEGYLFWSQGVTGVGQGAFTTVKDRFVIFPDFKLEKMLASWELLSTSAKWDKVDFYTLNIKRKYGDSWKENHAKTSSGRLKEWGLNTYGAWSNVSEDLNHPFTLIIHPHVSHKIGTLTKIVDPFSNDYRASLKRLLKENKKYKNNPYLLGIFVNNELHFGNEMSIPNQVLKEKNSIPARKAFEEFLQNKYQTIDALNSKWGSNYDSFKSIDGANRSKFTKVFREDLIDYSYHFASTYFRITSEELKKAFPNNLYFGSRFHGNTKTNKPFVKAASKYCDVISYNIYEFSVKDFKVFSEVDKPAIIGEFHFGTGSHGVWGVGLQVASNVEHQGQLYSQYIKEASQHPNFVGAHWFQWSDQPATGRADGENFRIGLVNITDQPYEKLIKAIKETSGKIFDYRTQPNK